MSDAPLAGLCPMGCGYSLVARLEGSVLRVWCSNSSCPRPSAVDELLHDGETEHLVTVHEDGVTVQHPLRERLDDGLANCAVLYALTVTHPPLHIPPGDYRLTTDEDGAPLVWQHCG